MYLKMCIDTFELLGIMELEEIPHLVSEYGYPIVKIDGMWYVQYPEGIDSEAFYTEGQIKNVTICRIDMEKREIVLNLQ